MIMINSAICVINEKHELCAIVASNKLCAVFALKLALENNHSNWSGANFPQPMWAEAILAITIKQIYDSRARLAGVYLLSAFS